MAQRLRVPRTLSCEDFVALSAARTLGYANRLAACASARASLPGLLLLSRP